MPNKPQGKLSLNDTQLDMIKKTHLQFFVKEDVNNYYNELELLNYIAFHIENY